jgi:hypothetical protein
VVRTLPKPLQEILVVLLLVLASPILVGLAVLVGIDYAGRRCALYALVWARWIGRAPCRVLFVYSDSPHWKDHIEQQVLPRLPANAVVLNWSRRQQWPRFSLPVLLFRTFAGYREFNPIALVFARFAFVQRFRFWQPFRDARHGKVEPLRRLEAALFERLEI